MEAYTAVRPGVAYLRRLLEGDSFIGCPKEYFDALRLVDRRAGGLGGDRLDPAQVTCKLGSTTLVRM